MLTLEPVVLCCFLYEVDHTVVRLNLFCKEMRAEKFVGRVCCGTLEICKILQS